MIAEIAGNAKIACHTNKTAKLAIIAKRSINDKIDTIQIFARIAKIDEKANTTKVADFADIAKLAETIEIAEIAAIAKNA